MAIEQFIPEEHDIDWLIARRDRLERDRDALLEACKGLLMRIAIAAIDNDPIMPQEPEIIAAQAAIALAEKEGA